MKTQGKPSVVQIMKPYALIASMVTAVPFAAMLFTEVVNWSLLDFIFIWTLVFGTGLVYYLVKSSTDKRYHPLILAGVVLMCLWLWAELAVGIFTNWGS